MISVAETFPYSREAHVLVDSEGDVRSTFDFQDDDGSYVDVSEQPVLGSLDPVPVAPEVHKPAQKHAESTPIVIKSAADSFADELDKEIDVAPSRDLAIRNLARRGIYPPAGYGE